MPNIVGMQFQKIDKLEYYTPNDLRLDSEDWTVVGSKRGIEIGVVELTSKYVNDGDVILPLKDTLYIATEEGIQQYKQNEKDTEQALVLCKQLVKGQDLDMRLVNYEYTLDKSRVISDFTTDDHIDFRKLVKVLAQNLRAYIKLRQIGVRDEVKLLGGIGPCGRSLCCSTSLGDSQPVSIKMTRDQNSSLDLIKISGACGRLVRCLKYENNYCEEARAQLPDIGDEIHTPGGTEKVVGSNILDVSMRVEIDGLEQPLGYKVGELSTFN